MQELFIKDNNLIEESKWKSKINNLETDFNNLETNKERAKRNLKEALLNSIKKRTENLENFGISFSGGVDSTLIAFLCKKLNKNFTCYSVGLENSQDIEAAKEIASFYNLDFKYKIITLEEFEEIVKKTTKILKTNDVMKVSVGCVDFAVLELAKKDNINFVFTGLGSEEIFAGYQRHEDSLQQNDFEGVHKECWNGLKNMWERDLLRDCAIGSEFNISLLTPFLDKDLISVAMQTHPMYKIDKENKKIILRETAADLGLKKEFALRPKKAAQYGSKFIKGIDKLAKKYNFKLKKNYLKSLL